MKFTIKAGRHYANKILAMRIMWGNDLRFRFKISRTAMYDPATVINGWSKVFGISEPLGHRNSCRLVFMVTALGMQIGMYCYLNGVSPQENENLKKSFGFIEPDLWYICSIERSKSYYKMSVVGNLFWSLPLAMPACRWILPFRFLLHPYIGGRFTLGNDCTIEIERIK